MKIKNYEKTAIDTLHVSGVEAELIERFEAYCGAQKAPKGFYMNQMLTDFFRSVEKQSKPKSVKSQKAAAA